ncbi:ATP-binding protein [Candidatus Poribacteria bacterium]|nr:ATP-binding protein [Candidatus Poribacteria bacterium]MYC40141.1 ATP-binding protein [Candidatus Dadabacteria bacterium]
MTELLSMPSEQIDSSHIKSFVDSRVPEGEHIEFKESLPAKEGALDPWMSGGNEIGDRAKNVILEEVTAFANAHGGALFLGIKECDLDKKPAVTDDISPVPRCEELAERLKLVFRDRVEPQLPRLEIFAVPTQGKSGVVIIRVGRSRLAPHRVTKILVCPVRRFDRCEKMTMREIQDMTLNMARGLERLDERLSVRRNRFQEEFECLETPTDAYGIRFTAMPIGDEIRIDRVFHRSAIVSEFNEPWRKIYIKQDNQEPYVLSDMGISSASVQCRPMLRAAREESDWGPGNTNRLYNSYRELHCDGLIEIGFVSCLRAAGSGGKLDLPRSFPVVVFANLVAWADRVRNQALVPTAEYVLDAEIRAIGNSAYITSNNRHIDTMYPTILQPSLIEFPRYSLGNPEEISELIGLFYRDFWNSLGKDIDTGEFTFEVKGWRDD